MPVADMQTQLRGGLTVRQNMQLPKAQHGAQARDFSVKIKFSVKKFRRYWLKLCQPMPIIEH